MIFITLFACFLFVALPSPALALDNNQLQAEMAKMKNEFQKEMMEMKNDMETVNRELRAEIVRMQNKILHLESLVPTFKVRRLEERAK